MQRKYLKNWSWLEVAIAINICAIVVLVFEPQIVRWWNQPAPGWIGIDYLAEAQITNESCLAHGYIVKLPSTYRQQAPCPLIIFLHGSGSRGNDPHGLLSNAKSWLHACPQDMKAVVLMPQCRPNYGWQPDDVRRLVDFATDTYHIDQARIYLIGYSMGGRGAWETASEFPELFAAVVSMAGDARHAQAGNLVGVPAWAFHGVQDEVIPAEESQRLIDAISELGGDPKLTMYPNAGHSIVSRALQTPELWTWLFEQRLKTREPE